MSPPRIFTTRLVDQSFGICITPEDLIVPFFDNTSTNYYRPWRLSIQNSQDIGSTIENDGESMNIFVDVQHFSPEEISVAATNDYVIIEGKHEEKADNHGFISRQFKRKYILPKDCPSEEVTSTLSLDGVLTITARKRYIESKEKIIPVTICTSTSEKKETTQCSENSFKNTSKSEGSKSTSTAEKESKNLLENKNLQIVLKEDHCRLLKSELLGEAILSVGDKCDITMKSDAKSISDIEMSVGVDVKSSEASAMSINSKLVSESCAKAGTSTNRDNTYLMGKVDESAIETEASQLISAKYTKSGVDSSRGELNKLDKSSKSVQVKKEESDSASAVRGGSGTKNISSVTEDSLLLKEDKTKLSSETCIISEISTVSEESSSTKEDEQISLKSKESNLGSAKCIAVSSTEKAAASLSTEEVIVKGEDTSKLSFESCVTGENLNATGKSSLFNKTDQCLMNREESIADSATRVKIGAKTEKVSPVAEMEKKWEDSTYSLESSVASAVSEESERSSLKKVKNTQECNMSSEMTSTSMKAGTSSTSEEITLVEKSFENSTKLGDAELLSSTCFRSGISSTSDDIICAMGRTDNTLMKGRNSQLSSDSCVKAGTSRASEQISSLEEITREMEQAMTSAYAAEAEIKSTMARLAESSMETTLESSTFKSMTSEKYESQDTSVQASLSSSIQAACEIMSDAITAELCDAAENN